MFIQVIQGRCNDPDRMRQLTEEWRAQLGPTAEGWLGGTYGITDDGEAVAVVRFDSREAASRNSARPEQGEWWQQMEACFDGEVTVHDCDNAMLFLGGGSDEAGFVQVIQGRIDDPERFRHFMERPMDALHEVRPEIIGGTLAMEPDGWFVQTIAFRTEEEARAGEQKQMPPEVRGEFEDTMAHVSDQRFLDLHRPWFASAG
ncbi:hypothetical protein I601_3211 [Nocardioides dokdonensis FR1436]|uniref:ABM domain-containing protein n=1 Tax=Nocardioides dokdonensis FR1436 TaxID=1300347 RepID=A0A1A9GMU9_9ACTN|nr:hypothetical protein [Nocardioides dokdonensis]ANH39618.1 hypothetical protein I601_3211 [Nocardioides dokdonensis FR1436]